MSDKVQFLDVAFDVLSQDEVERWLDLRTAHSPFAYVVTPNVDHVVRLAAAPPDVGQAYEQAHLCLCDSRVLARLARMVGVALPVVPGSDLVAALFARVLRPGDKICLIGGDESDADRLRVLYPSLKIIQHRPPMGLMSNPIARKTAADFAAATRARVTLLAVGSPQQELIGHMLAQRPDARGTALCIGASIDFLVGVQKRAPRVVQSMGIEWAWRLATNPRRMARRYLVDGPAIFPMLWRWQRARARRRP